MDNLIKIIFVVFVVFMLLNYSCEKKISENFSRRRRGRKGNKVTGFKRNKIKKGNKVTGFKRKKKNNVNTKEIKVITKIKVLFIGNSVMWTHNLPQIFKEISELHNYNIDYKFIRHQCFKNLNLDNIKNLVKNEGYKYVVINSNTANTSAPGSNNLDINENTCNFWGTFLHYGRILIKTILENDGIPVLLAHYPTGYIGEPTEFKWYSDKKLINKLSHLKFVDVERGYAKFMTGNEPQLNCDCYLNVVDKNGKTVNEKYNLNNDCSEAKNHYNKKGAYLLQDKFSNEGLINKSLCKVKEMKEYINEDLRKKIILAPAGRGWANGNPLIIINFLSSDMHHPNLYGNFSTAFTIFHSIFKTKYNFSKVESYFNKNINNKSCKLKIDNLELLKFIVDESWKAYNKFNEINTYEYRQKLDNYQENIKFESRNGKKDTIDEFKYEGHEYYNHLSFFCPGYEECGNEFIRKNKNELIKNGYYACKSSY